MKKILVTGGTGYIGSHTVCDLIEHGFDVISIDNYSRSSAAVLTGINNITGKNVQNYAVDLCNYEDTFAVFLQHPDIAGVIHFAAFKSVPESMEFPMRYYENNIFSLVNLLKCIEQLAIPYFVFSSSCSVYGNVTDLPVTESTVLAKPECAYAASKQMGEQIIHDFSRRHADINSILLRYFNPVGAHPSGEIGETPTGRPNNLVPVITQTAAGISDKMFVWGKDYQTRDGSCIRDYIHVMDIARAHTLALQYLIDGQNTQNDEVFNLGSGIGVTVLEAIKAFEDVSGLSLNYAMGDRRPGDVEAVFADKEKASRLLGWDIRYNLHDMMRTAWNWQQKLMQMR